MPHLKFSPKAPKLVEQARVSEYHKCVLPTRKLQGWFGFSFVLCNAAAWCRSKAYGEYFKQMLTWHKIRKRSVENPTLEIIWWNRSFFSKHYGIWGISFSRSHTIYGLLYLHGFSCWYRWRYKSTLR